MVPLDTITGLEVRLSELVADLRHLDIPRSFQPDCNLIFKVCKVCLGTVGLGGAAASMEE